MTAGPGKRGNTVWAQCPGCEGWIPVGPSMMEAPDIPLHCPHCHLEFAHDQAARIEDPGSDD